MAAVQKKIKMKAGKANSTCRESYVARARMLINKENSGHKYLLYLQRNLILP